MTYFCTPSREHLASHQNLWTRQFVQDVIEPSRQLTTLTPKRNNQSRRKSIFSKDGTPDKYSPNYRNRSVQRTSKQVFQQQKKQQQMAQNLKMNMIQMMQDMILVKYQLIKEQTSKNNDYIVKLQSEMRKNQSLLCEKTIEIKQLKSKLDKLCNNNESIDTQDYNASFQYLTSKLRDIEIKIWNISKHADGYNPQQVQQSLQKLENKIGLIEKQLLIDAKNKIKQIVDKTMIRYDSNNNRLNKIEKQLLQLEQTEQNNKNERTQKFNQMSIEASINNNQLLMIRQLMNRYTEKTFVYDNYQIKELRAKIQVMISTISEFQNQRVQINQYLKEVEKQNMELLVKFSNSKKQQNVGVGKIKSKKESRVQNYIIQKGFDRLMSTKSSGQYTNESDTIFHVDDSADNYQSFDTETSQFGQQNIKFKLLETLRKMGNSIPLQCEVDETGYLKYKKSGTYVFDVDGNLFHLNKKILKELVEDKIILI